MGEQNEEERSYAILERIVSAVRFPDPVLEKPKHASHVLVLSVVGVQGSGTPCPRIGQAFTQRRRASLRLTTLASSHLLMGPATLAFDSLHLPEK